MASSPETDVRASEHAPMLNGSSGGSSGGLHDVALQPPATAVPPAGHRRTHDGDDGDVNNNGSDSLYAPMAQLPRGATAVLHLKLPVLLVGYGLGTVICILAAASFLSGLLHQGVPPNSASHPLRQAGGGSCPRDAIGGSGRHEGWGAVPLIFDADFGSFME